MKNLEENPLLMIPGPTPVPHFLLMELSHAMINHRGAEFAELFSEILEGMKWLFQTKNDMMVFPASGTGAMEASLVNVLSPGDRVLSVSIGAFGDRYATIAKNFGAEVVKLDMEWGNAVNPDDVKKALQKEKNIKAVLLTQNETSTGVVNPVEAVAKIVKDYGALLLVDAISGLGAVELQSDAWGVDCTVAGSQKAMMIPPGLSFVSVSQNAWEAHKNAKMPRYYWDFSNLKKWTAKNQTPYTPALPQLFALRASLKWLKNYGLKENFKRHQLMGKMARAGANALSFHILAKEECASPCVTAVCGREGVDIKKVRAILRDKYNIVTAGGQGKLEDKIFRIGHLGWVFPSDLIRTFSALELALEDCGVSVEKGSAVRACERVILEAEKTK